LEDEGSIHCSCATLNRSSPQRTIERRISCIKVGCDSEADKKG